VNGLEAEYGEQMTFTRLNVDEPANQEIQQQYRLRGHPSVAIINANGEIVQTFVGVQSAETVRPIIEQAVSR
jgi:thioredoxin-like negative regulator of GroEL